MRNFLDLDLVLYARLFVTKDQPFYKQIRACDDKVQDIIDRVGAEENILVTSGPSEENFRYKVDASYKANRKDAPRPQYLYDARKYFQKHWGAIVPVGIEPDDFIATYAGEDDVISTIDKDYNQLDRKIYNWNKNTLEYGEGLKYWWIQMLIGDSADGIPGVPNPAKAHYKTKPCFTEATARELLEGLDLATIKSVVQEIYQQSYPEGWFQQFDTKARLLFLQRKPNDNYFEWI